MLYHIRLNDRYRDHAQQVNAPAIITPRNALAIQRLTRVLLMAGHIRRRGIGSASVILSRPALADGGAR